MAGHKWSVTKVPTESYFCPICLEPAPLGTGEVREESSPKQALMSLRISECGCGTCYVPIKDIRRLMSTSTF